MLYETRLDFKVPRCE